MSPTSAQPRPHRGRGRPPRIGRDMIVAAAREIDLSTLTLQAVATRLGVDRKAITYHVSGLDELTALVASANLADELADLDLSGGDRQDAVRAYAVATRDTLLRTPSLAMVIERIPGAGCCGRSTPSPAACSTPASTRP